MKNLVIILISVLALSLLVIVNIEFNQLKLRKTVCEFDGQKYIKGEIFYIDSNSGCGQCVCDDLGRQTCKTVACERVLE